MPNEDMKNKIKALRFLYNWTQNDLAEKSGISKSTIFFVENGDVKTPTISTMRGIAAAFGKKVEEVFDINGTWEEDEWKKVFIDENENKNKNMYNFTHTTHNPK